MRAALRTQELPSIGASAAASGLLLGIGRALAADCSDGAPAEFPGARLEAAFESRSKQAMPGRNLRYPALPRAICWPKAARSIFTRAPSGREAAR